MPQRKQSLDMGAYRPERRRMVLDNGTRFRRVTFHGGATWIFASPWRDRLKARHVFSGLPKSRDFDEYPRPTGRGPSATRRPRPRESAMGQSARNGKSA